MTEKKFHSHFKPNPHTIATSLPHITTLPPFGRFSSENNRLLLADCGGMLLGVVAKSTTSRRKLINQTLANDSTPFNRAFFVRSLRTPKECQSKNGSAILSMVGRKGQRFVVGCVPKFAVFLPLYALPPNRRKFSDRPIKSTLELSAMIYKFLLTGTKRPRITIHTNNKAEALNRVHFTSKPLLRLRNPLVKNPQNMTACNTEQNNRLLLADCGGMLFGTTKTYNGHRTRKICGFFVSQISQCSEQIAPECRSEFAVRLISRNKADCICTNKASRLYAVVETVSPLSRDIPFSLTKHTTMNKPTLNPLATLLMFNQTQGGENA